MDKILELASVFMLGGTAGWICELFYRRLAHGKWINPGFLTGPCLPLYGTGVTVLYLLCGVDVSFIKGEFWQKTAVIAVIAVAMTVIEYITGIIFTKKFHVWLWDYTNCKGNIQGVICPLFSLIWALAGAGYLLFAHKYTVALARAVSARPFYSFLTGIYIGVFAVDAGYSFNIATKIKQWAETRNLGVRYEHLKVAVRTRAEELKGKKRFVFPFGGTDLREELENYGRILKERAINRLKK